jgi:uncharacterized protein DUF1360
MFTAFARGDSWAMATRRLAPVVEREQESPVEPIDYGALNLAYGALLAAVVLATRERAAKEGPIGPQELIPMGAATFAISKMVAREKIGTWVREPFVDERAGRPRPRGRRLRRAVGELLTCTRCVGAWSGLAVVGLRLASPAAGRTVTTVFATAAVNDFLQAGFRLICDSANRPSAASRRR